MSRTILKAMTSKEEARGIAEEIFKRQINGVKLMVETITDIESIVKEMTEASKKFYQDPHGERNIQKMIQYRDFLKKLIEKTAHTIQSERVVEIQAILFDAIVYFDKKITQLARYH